jgi:carbon storage regulator
MLVLTRKKNESVVINNDVTITVVEIRGDRVRLGIVAPAHVPILREELHDLIHRRMDWLRSQDPASLDPMRPAEAEPEEVSPTLIVDLKLSQGAPVRFDAEGGFSVG